MDFLLKRYIFREVHTKAMEQLKKGQAWLEHIMKMLNMTPWTYVGYAAFPNIDNKNTLKETGLDIKEDEFKVTCF